MTEVGREVDGERVFLQEVRGAGNSPPGGAFSLPSPPQKALPSMSAFAGPAEYHVARGAGGFTVATGGGPAAQRAWCSLSIWS